jgi:deoxycytidylate deaminase
MNQEATPNAGGNITNGNGGTDELNKRSPQLLTPEPIQPLYAEDRTVPKQDQQTNSVEVTKDGSAVAYRRRGTSKTVNASYTPDKDSELVIALVAAVGTDLSVVTSVLTERLKTFRYTATEIKISNQIIAELCTIPESPHFERTSSLMSEGNDLRKKTSDFSVLAKLAAAKINEIRQEGKPKGELPPMPRRAFIISSLKHPAEVAALRKIYANGFFLIGVHANKEMRYDYLHRNKNVPKEQVAQLFERDQDEAEKHGQHTRDTYHLSDFFVDFGDQRNKFEKDVWRILDLIFGKPFVTPTFDEFAMFMAFSASLRSADLSRQVGAVVTKDHAIVSTGANDVPRFGGGLYWPNYHGGSEIQDIPNGRDYVRTGDTNVIEKNDIIDDILSKFPQDQRSGIRDILANSKLKNITEYGRVVHAEMEAILSCARGNIGTHGAHLYCTTFPCHNCAKHIVAAGITKVVYVEPYPKSKAADFHDDSITLIPSEAGKVVFEPFVGVGPRSFFNLFSLNLGTGYEIARKTKDGKPVEWDEQHATLRMQMLPTSYIERESITTNKVNQLLEIVNERT